MMSILGAGVKGNTMIDLICDGQDELAFMDELKSAFADGFGESVQCNSRQTAQEVVEASCTHDRMNSLNRPSVKPSYQHLQPVFWTTLSSFSDIPLGRLAPLSHF